MFDVLRNVSLTFYGATATLSGMKTWQRLLFNWSAEKAWFLGVLYGDGNVYMNQASGDYRVSACGALSTTTRWLALIDASRTPKEFLRSPGTYQAYVNDKELVEWFDREMNICGPKSASLVWPKDLPSEFERDFLRGLYDTDGSLFIELRRRKKGQGNDYPRTKFDSKCESFVIHLRSRFEYLLGVERVAIEKALKKHSVWYTLKYGGAPAMKVADYLYSSYPLHLVNDDRVEAYKRLCFLRDHIADQECACGRPVTHEGRCQKCWWANHGTKTGVGTVCSTPDCGKLVAAKGLCTTCYNRLRRADPSYVRKTTGTCSCGGVAYRKGLCDRCYTAARRASFLR